MLGLVEGVDLIQQFAIGFFSEMHCLTSITTWSYAQIQGMRTVRQSHPELSARTCLTLVCCFDILCKRLPVRRRFGAALQPYRCIPLRPSEATCLHVWPRATCRTIVMLSVTDMTDAMLDSIHIYT